MVIKEFLPNPIGKDVDGEYIKLFNEDNKLVNLNNWQVKDVKGRIFKLDNYQIDGGKELILNYQITKITLNNDGETIFLYDASGELIDQLSYSGKAEEGLLILKKNSEKNPEVLENLPQASGQIVQVGLNFQFWFLLILIGVILASLSLYLIRKYEIFFSK